MFISCRRRRREKWFDLSWAEARCKMAPLPANDSEGSKIADLLSLVARLGTQVEALFFSPSGDLRIGLVWDILFTRKNFLIWVSDEKVFYSWKYCLWWSKMIEDDPKVLDGPNVISNESIDLIKKDLMKPKFLMIQKEFWLEVRTLIILKYTANPPCLLVLFF